MDTVEQLLKEHGDFMKKKDIERELKKRYGWEWGNFTATFGSWKQTDPRPTIKRIGQSYKYEPLTEIKSKPKEGDQENEIIETTETS